MQRAVIVHPHRQEMPHLHSVLIIGEHRRGKLITRDEDLRHQAEALTDEDRRRQARINNSGPVIGVSPFWDGHHVPRLAPLQVLAVDVAGVFQGGVNDLHGREL